MAALVLASIAGSAAAKPKRRDSKAAFDRGVAAYKKNNYEGASAALGKSYELEPDVDTLFAWAQSERKLDHCDKASELYEKLLTSSLPAENKVVVQQKLDECRQILAAQAPPPPVPEPAPPPVSVATAPGAAVVAPPADAPPTEAHRAWYKDPIALSLLGAGVVAGGVGGGFLASASSNNSKFKTAKSYADAKKFSDNAKSQSKIGVIAASAGGVLIVGGVVWIFTHRGSAESPPVTAWLAPSGGGLAFTGGF